MRSAKHITLLILSVFLLPHYAFAQDKCGTDDLPVNKKESVEQFEQWIEKEIENQPREHFGIEGLTSTQQTVQIPVVVHVIHDGELVGTGGNISDAQIISQIEVLNEDFRRKNSDATNTPSVFSSVAADIEVEFILAKQDPDGLPTDGIVRVQGSASSWGINDGLALSSHSYWPAEDYFNIWVTNLNDPYLGYAQFPVSTLPGMEKAEDERLTDGVVIDYFVFGSVSKDPQAHLHSRYDLGRTTTHEVGHFLGLRHIWGDGNCDADDYCTDTPSASKSNVSLDSPCTFPGPNSCGSGTSGDLADMFQNYMDYTDDVCMNLFTLDQKERIKTVLANSPRRTTLLTSPGLQVPSLPALNLEIRQISIPDVAVCGDFVTPELVVRNYGENTINSASIELYLEGNLIETLHMDNMQLETYENDTVIFNTHSFSAVGDLDLNFQIISVNGSSDNSSGNVISIAVPVLETNDLPLIENFETFPNSNWTISNTDNGNHTWSIKDAPYYQWDNKALATSFYSDNNVGTQEILTSSAFYFPKNSPVLLSFDVAYARYKDEKTEGLKVLISTDCGNTFKHIIFEKYGEELQTHDPTTSEFKPSGEKDWRSEVIDLSQYAGNTVRISFVAINEYGNNLYLDNISLTTEQYTDLQIARIVSPTPAQCDGDVIPTLLLNNQGTAKIGSASIEIILNGVKGLYNVEFTDSLSANNSATLNFQPVKANEGENSLYFLVVSVNGMMGDNNSANNAIARNFLIDNTSEILPLRENFDDFDISTWSILNMDEQLTWELVTHNQNKIASFPSSVYAEQKDEDWLLSPVMDLSRVNEASFFFDIAYSGDTPDRLRILYTDDCGLTYQPLGYDKQGEELSTYDVNKEFKREYVSLESIVGLKNVRLALVATGGKGSNIDIDNIEVFLSDVFSPIVPDEDVVLFPNPARGPVNLSFKLAQKEDVEIQVFDHSGKQRAVYMLNNTLNQTHKIDLSAQPPGVYIIKITGRSFQTAKRLVIY